MRRLAPRFANSVARLRGVGAKARSWSEIMTFLHHVGLCFDVCDELCRLATSVWQRRWLHKRSWCETKYWMNPCGPVGHLDRLANSGCSIARRSKLAELSESTELERKHDFPFPLVLTSFKTTNYAGWLPWFGNAG